jgi:hypothetical protein
MDSAEYRAISEAMLGMDVTKEFLENQRMVMIQNRPYLAKTIDYFKGPLVRIPLTDGKIRTTKSGKFDIQTLSKDTSAYKVNTGINIQGDLEFTDLILLPIETTYKKENVLGDNWQAKQPFLHFKAGSKKKGNKVEVLLRNTGITVERAGKKYVVFQHFPLKGTKYSSEYGSIRKQEDFASKVRKEIVPVYSTTDIQFILEQLQGSEVSNIERPVDEFAFEHSIFTPIPTSSGRIISINKKPTPPEDSKGPEGKPPIDPSC